ncbi:hypothetical protein TUM12370_37770 [Salmonella enterica subsp. enterica serovar Choleraesuis]|nr:hypothetical protein TUM12370_37770 [Salmonella enterica subsp. enterica serovar Choleraesuis]
MLKILFSAALLALSAAACAAPEAPSVAPVDARHYVAGLGTGMLVSWASTERGIREFDPLAVRDFQQRGISHIGIRVSGEPTSRQLLHLRKIIEACVSYRVTPVIIWEGPASGGLSENALAAWWSAVTRYFKGQYPQLGFMVLGESERDTRSAAALNHLYEGAQKVIHKIDPQRIVILAPHLHAAPEMLPELHWPAQGASQVVAGWHLFGAGPQKVNGHTPWSKGTAAEKAAIHARIRAVVRWQQKTGRITMISAFSPLTASQGNTPAARSLATFVACELKQAHIPFMLAGDNRFYDGEEGAWRPEMSSLLDAVLHPVCPSPGSEPAAKPAAKPAQQPAPQPVIPHRAG